MRLIDADALLEKEKGAFDDRVVFVDDIINAPTIEPKKGEWIEGRCSICGEHAPFWSMASNYYKSKYCHNCGSLMLNGMTMDEIFGKTESTVSKTDTDNAKYSCEAEQTDCPWG